MMVYVRANRIGLWDVRRNSMDTVAAFPGYEDFHIGPWEGNLSHDGRLIVIAAKKGMSGAVKSSHAIAIADLKTFPTVAQLATYVNGEGINAANAGIDVDIDGATHTVPTFTGSDCTGPTTATTDVVQCVGTIP